MCFSSSLANASSSPASRRAPGERSSGLPGPDAEGAGSLDDDTAGALESRVVLLNSSRTSGEGVRKIEVCGTCG